MYLKDVEEEWVRRIRTIKYRGGLLLNEWTGKRQDPQTRWGYRVECKRGTEELHSQERSGVRGQAWEEALVYLIWVDEGLWYSGDGVTRTTDERSEGCFTTFG
jgi:hypothetical protein